MAEYDAMCATAEELLHLKSISGTLRVSSVSDMVVWLCGGLGKVKAVMIRSLWLQEVHCPELMIRSVPSRLNKADLETKELSDARMRALCEAYGIVMPVKPPTKPLDDVDGELEISWW